MKAKRVFQLSVYGAVVCLTRLSSGWFVQLHDWSAEKIHVEQQSQEKVGQLQQNVTILEAERQALRDAVVSSAQCFKDTLILGQYF